MMEQLFGNWKPHTLAVASELFGKQGFHLSKDGRAKPRGRSSERMNSAVLS
jgi:hypothetical protein